MPFASQKIPALMYKAEKRGNILDSLPENYQNQWKLYCNLENQKTKLHLMELNRFLWSIGGFLLSLLASAAILNEGFKVLFIISLILGVLIAFILVIIFRKVYQLRIQKYKKSLPKNLDFDIRQMNQVDEIKHIKRMFKEHQVGWN